MKDVTIEWRHLEKDGATCDRCSDTGALLRDLVSGLNRECAGGGVRFVLDDVPLGPERIAESNMVRIDGRPLEDLLAPVGVGASGCSSCSDLTGQDEVCRTVTVGATAYEVPPPALVREAVCKVVGCCG